MGQVSAATTANLVDREECLPDHVKEAPLCAPFGVPQDDFCQLLCVNSNFLIPGASVEAGGHWTPWSGWITNGESTGLPMVYPAGYEPRFPNDPMRDFRSKLEEVRITVDPGTRQERIHRYTDIGEISKSVSVGEAFPFEASQDPADPWWKCPALFFKPVEHPLSVGAHRIGVTFVMSASHCDGVDPSWTYNCIPEGEAPALFYAFGVDVIDVTVVPH
jgi:hypothetical protein